MKMKVCQNNNHWDTAGRGSYHCVLAFLCLHLTRYVTIIQTDRLFYNKVKKVLNENCLFFVIKERKPHNPALGF